MKKDRKKSGWIKPSFEYERFYESKNYGTVEVIGRKSCRLRIKFLNTGNEYWAENSKVVSGDVCDSKLKNFVENNFTPYHEEFVNNDGHKFKAISKKGSLINIVFYNTGHTATVYLQNARKGKTKDPYEPSVYGVGYTGEFCKKSNPDWKQARQLWKNMMKRCYSTKDPRGYYGHAFVSAPWYEFAKFLEDIKELDGYHNWLSGQKSDGVKYNLDKDSILEGNNIYAKSLCRFLTESENKSMGARATKEQYRRNMK